MPLATMKKKKLKHYYETHDSELKNFDGELRIMKIEELQKDLHAQQNVMTSFCSTNDDGLTMSNEVS